MKQYWLLRFSCPLTAAVDEEPDAATTAAAVNSHEGDYDHA